MTQLTFNQKPGCAYTEDEDSEGTNTDQRTLPPSNVDASMARIRRNSGCGRRRQGSEQPESGGHRVRRRLPTHGIREFPADQNLIRLDGQTDFDGSATQPTTRNVYHPGENYSHYSNANFSLPMTSGLPGQVTLSPGSFSSSSYVVERQETLSPLVFTPTHSSISQEHVNGHDEQFEHIEGPRQDSSLPFDKGRNYGMQEPLAGIDAICESDANDWLMPRPNESTSPSSMMLPSALQHVRDLDEPWSPLDNEGAMATAQSPAARSTPPSHRSVDFTVDQSPRPLGRGGSRAGRRQGPLSLESRQNANDVRKERSCLRCFVYKETCDTKKDICQNCSSKQPRTWKLGCVRPRLMFRTQYMLPDILAGRLERRYVDSFIQHKGWTCRDKPRFAIPLDIGLGTHLVMPVREFLPIGDLNRPAYLPVENGKESTAVPITMYDLPVVISCDKEEEAANHIRHSLLRWFQQTIDCTHDSDWAWHWFNKRSDTFAGNAMKLICEYFQAGIVQHRLLKEALALSFFNYIFIYSFNVPDDHVPMLQQRLETRIPKDTEYISPSIINLYIKMLMLPPLRDVVKRTLRGLELLLLDQQNPRLWRRDLIFCVSFIVLAYLGRTQVSILQFAHQPARDGSKVLSHEEAEKLIMEMETQLGDLIIKYHHQFLSPSPRRKTSTQTAGDSEQVAEDYAQDFHLMDRIRKLREDTTDSRPQSVEPQCRPVGDFIANNTTRICWKFVDAILPLEAMSRDPRNAMDS